ncbi:MAG: cytidylate kinase-like family protein [Acidobacteriaceae bacterium]|nr:cytidylate kinase-like family protein [Acidobacteriaceae bacterium]
MIRTVTIEREYGSGGGAIAKKLADRLGWRLWDHAVTCEIAKRLKCDVSAVEQREERCDPTFYRLMKAFMRGSYEDQLGTGAVDMLDAEHLSKLFEKIALDIAAQGNAVIVGRGSTWFLRNRPDSFHMFVYAPHAEKMRRLRAQGFSEADADDLVQRVDQERATFVKRYYNKNWPTRDLYHMMINSVIGDEAVVELVLHEINILNSTRVETGEKAS